MFHGIVRLFPLVALLAVSPMAFAQSASELLEKGIFEEETAGDLDAAIGIYQQIVENHDANHRYIARAQFRLGECYAKKGQPEDAASAFRKVVAYPDQPALVAQARVRLADLGFGTNGETLAMTTRQVWVLPQEDNNRSQFAPSPDGRYLSHIHWTTDNMAVHDFETGETRDITDDGILTEDVFQYPDFHVWSPDSSRIAYQWSSKRPDGWSELRIVGLDGSEPRVLGDRSRPPWVGHPLVPWAWSPDGKFILGVIGTKDDILEKCH